MTLTLFALSVSRSDAVGYALLLVTIGFTVAGYLLSRAGLAADAKAKAVGDVAEKAQSAVADATQTNADAQKAVAQMTGPSADAVADNTAKVVQTASVVRDQVAQVNAALDQLTGNQAPARVMWALALLSLLAALVSFDIVSLEIASHAATPKR
jgi:hypothetical protein